MKRSKLSALNATAATLLAATALLISPASVAQVAPSQEQDVASAELIWGFKESFRSYISGNIAKGSWEVSDGAHYETPSFIWDEAEGQFDTEQGTGSVHFRGAVEFTGHDGQLSTQLENPTLEFTGPDTAYLLLDVTGVSMADALAGNDGNVLTFEQVRFAELDVSSGFTIDAEAGVIQGTDIPTTITAEGFEAFPNYEAGTAFDPVSFTVNLEDLTPEPSSQAPDSASQVAEEGTEENPSAPDQSATDQSSDAAATSQDGESGASPAVIIGGVAVAAAIGAAIYLGVRRRRAASE